MDRNHLIFIRVWVCCLAGIALLVTSGQGVEIYNPTPICPYDWTVSNVTPNGTCLQGVVSPANWTMAQERCRNVDSFLLKIESDRRRIGQQYVRMVFEQGLGDFWTGLHVHDKTGHFVWDELGPFKVEDFISNDRLSFVWAEGQPDIRSGSCVSARAGAGLNSPLSFSLRPCSQRRPFICQRSKVVPEASPGSPCFNTFYGGLYSDECYKIEGRTLSQSDAQRNCGRIHGGGDQYGQLVEPKSKLDEQYLMNAVLKWHNEQVEISSEMEFWTGLQFDQSAERLTWMSGSAVSFGSYLVQEDLLGGGPPSANFNCAKLVVSPPIIDTPATPEIRWLWRNCSLPAVQICQLARAGFGKPDLRIAVVMDGVNKTSQKNQFGGDLPLDISIPISSQNPSFLLEFNLVFRKITKLEKEVNVQNWIAGQPAMKQQRQGLQGYHWANVWQAHPLKKHRTNRILIIEQHYLTYRCEVDVSALFIIPTAAMNNYNLFGYTLRQAAEKWQELGIVYQMFDQTVPRLLAESLAPWETSVSLRRFQLHVQGRTVKQIVHFDVYLSGRYPDTRMSDRDDFSGRQNLTQALTTVLRSLLVEYESLEALRNRTLSSLKVFSTRHCFPTETVPSTGVHRQPFCPETEDSAVEAVCGGDFYDGLRWKVAKAGCTTTPLTTPSTTTGGESSINDELDKILQQEVNAETSFDISQSVAQLSANPSMLNTETIGKITDILERIADQNTIDIMSGGRLCQTVENLMNVEESVLRMSQRVNSTSTRLLKTLDRYTGHADLGRPNQKQTYTTLAVDMWDVRPGQSVYGVRLLQSPPGGDPFTNQTFQNAERDSDDDDEDDNEMEYNITNVEVAIFLPPSLIKEKLQVTPQGQNLRMSFIIQTNPVLFKDVSLRSSQSLLNGSVISATLGDSEIVGLPADQRIRAVFYSPQTNISKPMCVFWDFGLNAGSGGWSGAGCELLNTTSPGGYYECLCDHLTNFAVLMDFGGPIDPVNNKILTVITIVGLSLSIIGLSLTVLSFLLFRKLREGNTQKTMFHLALSLLAAWILFLVGIILSQESLHDRVGCQVVAVLLHYFLLASFMWMLVEAVLQYLRFVKVLGTYIPKFLLKASVIAWGVPLIPVIVVLAINTDLYYRSGSANVTKFCWMDQYTSYFAFLLPVGLIIVVNAVVFILIVWAITHRPKGLQSNQSKTKNNMISLQAAIACFILLGLTWIFGFLAIEDARLVFQYLFTILNSFHGLFIFVFFTLREKKVRQQWLELCCPKIARKQLYTSSEMYSNTQKRGSEETLSGGTTDTVVPSRTNKPRFKRIDSSGNSVILEPDSSKKMLNGPKN